MANQGCSRALRGRERNLGWGVVQELAQREPCGLGGRRVYGPRDHLLQGLAPELAVAAAAGAREHVFSATPHPPCYPSLVPTWRPNPDQDTSKREFGTVLEGTTLVILITPAMMMDGI